MIIYDFAMAEGGPHWHPDDIGKLTYAQVLLFIQDRTELVQRLKNKRKYGDDQRIQSVDPSKVRSKVKTAPGGKSLAQHLNDQQAKERKESRHAKRRRRKRRKNRG